MMTLKDLLDEATKEQFLPIDSIEPLEVFFKTWFWKKASKLDRFYTYFYKEKQQSIIFYR